MAIHAGSIQLPSFLNGYFWDVDPSNLSRSADFDWFTPDPLGDPLAFTAKLEAEGLAIELAEIGRGVHRTILGVRAACSSIRIHAPAPRPVA